MRQRTNTVDIGDLPVGGTTGVSHEHSAVIDEAASWLSQHGDRCDQVTVPVLRQLFGLSADDACAALSDVREIGGRDAITS